MVFPISYGVSYGYLNFPQAKRAPFCRPSPMAIVFGRPGQVFGAARGTVPTRGCERVHGLVLSKKGWKTMENLGKPDEGVGSSGEHRLEHLG